MNKNILDLRYLKIVVVGISLGLISPSISNERFPSKILFSNSFAQSTPLENVQTSPTPSTVPTPSIPAFTPTASPTTPPTPTASPTTPPTPTASPTTPPTPTTNDQLLIGSWQAKDSRGDTLTLTFEEKNRLTIKFSDSSGGSNQPKPAQYRVTPPKNLDLIFEKDKIIQTIFEIKDQGKLLRIPLQGLTYQTPRPKTIEPTQVREFTRVEPINSSK